MRKILAVAVTALATLTFGAPVAADSSADARAYPSGKPGYAMVTLRSPAAAEYTGGIRDLKRTKPLRGKLDTSSPAYLAYRKHLQNEHARFAEYLRRNAPGARITREYFTVLNGVAVKLNGNSIARLRGSADVAAAGRSWLYRPQMNVSNDLIGSPAAWAQLGGQSTAGSGIRVAVIDSGIDLSNRFFDDSGMPSAVQIDQCDDQDNDPATPDTNNKVTVCRLYHSGVTTGRGGGTGDPELCNDHGTHVAGTIGGRAGTSGTVQGTDVVLTDLSGVAPGVQLGSYNVFPCIGSGWTAFGGSAFSHDIAAAIEDAVMDGMDVANMSLGGAVQGPHDFLADASDAAVAAGMVLVVSAGNSGPGGMTIGSPGSAHNVITAGASTNPHFVGVPVTADPTGAPAPRTIGGAVGDFDPFAEDEVTDAAYTTTSPANGCSAITTALAGKVALIDRGVCTFGTKVMHAQNAGAIGVIIVNNVAGDPTAMGGDPTVDAPEIPAVMVGKVEGNALKPTGTVTIDGDNPQEFFTDNEDILAGFSSRGPTPFTYLIKPDLTAPGVNIASSVFGDEFAFFQGTSMAAPHLSGVAALILDEYSGASPAEVKSRMVNNAARTVTDHVNGTVDPGVLARGGGRVDVPAAFNAATWFAPSSVTFGLVRGERPFSESRTIAVGGADATAAAVVHKSAPPAGLIVSASLSNSGNTLTVSMSVAGNVPNGDYEGDIQVTATDGQSYLVPFWVRVTNR